MAPLTADTVFLRPTEPGERCALRTVLAADPAGIAELVQKIVEEGVVDLADIGLVAPRRAGDLDVADARHQALRPFGEIALHDLAVIEIELQPRIVARDAVEDGDAFGRRVEEIARYVAGVDRLDDHGDAVLLGEIGGVAYILDIDRLALRLRLSRRPQTGHRVDGPTFRRLGIVDGPRDTVAKFLFAAGQRGETALAGGPISRRRVEQRLSEMVRLQPVGDVAGLEIVGEEELDPTEPRLGRRAEAVEKIDLLEHHAEIGGEFRHGDILHRLIVHPLPEGRVQRGARGRGVLSALV